MATLEEIAAAETKDLSVRQKVEAFYKGTDALTKFSTEAIVPILRGQLDLSDREMAIVGIYLRMHAWMHSLVTLNSRIHFQAAASATRTLFELMIDIKLLAQDTDGSQVARFHAITLIERHRVAKQVVKFKDGHPDSEIDDEHQRSLVTTEGKQDEIDTLAETHWGLTKGKPRKPDHWSGMNVRERATHLGPEYEEMYIESYPNLSWAVHSGSASYAGLEESTLEGVFGLSHAQAQRHFMEALEIVASEMHINKAIEGLADVLDGLRITSGIVIAEEQARQIDEAREKAKSEFSLLD